MGCCYSKAFVAPCCRCYTVRIFVRLYDQEEMSYKPKGAPYFARYRLKKGVSEEDRSTLYRYGYKDLFPEDPSRPLYSCDCCYQEAGRIFSDAWEYNEKGFMRK